MKKAGLCILVLFFLCCRHIAYSIPNVQISQAPVFPTPNYDRSPWDYTEWIGFIQRYFDSEECLCRPGEIYNENGTLYWDCEITGEDGYNYNVYVIFDRVDNSKTINRIAIVCPYDLYMQTETAEKIFDGFCWICLREICGTEDIRNIDSWYEEARWEWLPYYMQGDELDHPYVVKTRVCFQKHKSEREAKEYAVRYIKPKGKQGVGVE